MWCAWLLAAYTAVLRRRSFFFFQAEDGIRDLTVTGVQTCALPISPVPRDPRAPGRESAARLGPLRRHLDPRRAAADDRARPHRRPRPGRRREVARSEERRVGKECRSRWSPYH